MQKISEEVVADSENQRNRREKRSAETSFLIPGRTLVLGDSFSEAAESFYTNYFKDITLINLNNFSAKSFLREIVNSDRVIIWSVERSFPYRVAYDWGTPDFIASLNKILK